MSFGSILQSLQQQFSATWQAITGFVTSGAQDLGQAVSGTATAAADLAITGIDNIGQSLQDLSNWTNNQLAAVYSSIQDITNQVAAMLGSTSERARQYLLGRLRVNPLGVLSEGLLVAHQAGGQLSLPDPNLSSPWGALDELVQDILTFGTDPSHAAHVAITEMVADLEGVAAGRRPVIPPAPTDPSQVPTFPPLSNPAGADPNATALLTQDDQSYISSTTSGAA